MVNQGLQSTFDSAFDTTPGKIVSHVSIERHGPLLIACTTNEVELKNTDQVRTIYVGVEPEDQWLRDNGYRLSPGEAITFPVSPAPPFYWAWELPTINVVFVEDGYRFENHTTQPATLGFYREGFRCDRCVHFEDLLPGESFVVGEKLLYPDGIVVRGDVADFHRWWHLPPIVSRRWPS